MCDGKKWPPITYKQLQVREKLYTRVVESEGEGAREALAAESQA